MSTKYRSTLPAAEGKSCDRIQRNTCAIRGKWFALALGGFLFTSHFALTAPAVEAQCQQYDVSGQWTIIQGSYIISVALNQNGKIVSGTASQVYGKTTGSSGDVEIVHGQVNGTIEGDSFNVQINWSGGGVGVYSGAIKGGGDGLQGTTYDKNRPSNTARWGAPHRFDCAAAAPAPVPKPISKSGKAPIPAPKPISNSGKAKSSTATPTIKVQPVLVIIPEGQSRGRTTVTWDGGPDHPNAEVWMKGSSEEKERFVIQQGKGTRSVTVGIGQHYRFILKDAGQELAKAAVLTKQ